MTRVVGAYSATHEPRRQGARDRKEARGARAGNAAANDEKHARTNTCALAPVGDASVGDQASGWARERASGRASREAGGRAGRWRAGRWRAGGRAGGRASKRAKVGGLTGVRPGKHASGQLGKRMRSPLAFS